MKKKKEDERKSSDWSSEVCRTVCGTPAYFAPEILARQFSVTGAGTYSVEADLWSCGVLLYVLLAGAFPFNADDLERSIPAARYTFDTATWGEVGDDAKDLVSPLLVPDPKPPLPAAPAL